MKIGTKSVLFGVHCFFIHPWFVALAWWKLYGFPYDPRLWVAFFVHDLGYIGKPNMDGPEGEMHPYAGARIMGFLFGHKWNLFTLHHSRFLAKRNNSPFSKLCVADKLAFSLTPRWLYLLMANWTGEIREYMHLCAQQSPTVKYASASFSVESQIKWHADVKRYLTRWAVRHRHETIDTWTKIGPRKAIEQTGVFQ